MIALLVWFVVICIIMYAVKTFVPMPAPMDKIFYFVCLLIGLGFVVYCLQAFGVMGPLPKLR